MDDIDVLWVCGGQNVDDVDVFFFVCAVDKMWMMWMFYGCEVTMLYLHISVSHRDVEKTVAASDGQRAYSAHESQTVNPRGMVVGGTLARRD